jgi:hypothetical protein
LQFLQLFQRASALSWERRLPSLCHSIHSF